MTYWYIIAGIWTFLALAWTAAWLSSDAEGGRASKLERFVSAMEDFVFEYRRKC